MKNSAPKAPKGLTAEARRRWIQLRDDFDISDPAGLLILTTALEAFDRMRQAQRLLATEGLTIVDRFGQQKGHPLTVIERDSRAAMLGALKALNLDLEPLNERPGRPNGR